MKEKGGRRKEEGGRRKSVHGVKVSMGEGVVSQRYSALW